MPFLHALIHQKIERANLGRARRREERCKVPGLSAEDGAETLDWIECEERDFPKNVAESMEGISHSENVSSSSMKTYRLKHVSVLGY